MKGNERVASVWAGAAVAGVVAYVLIDVALVFLRPRFSVLHNAESDGPLVRFAYPEPSGDLSRFNDFRNILPTNPCPS